MTGVSEGAAPRVAPRSVLAALLPYAIFLLVGGYLFPSAGRDDAHITYWAARTLTTTGSILNYSGARLEQSSSLLQVLTLAAAWRLIRIDLVTLAALQSVALGLVAIWMSGFLATAVGVGRGRVEVVLATLTPFVYWSFSGHEASLAAVCILGFALAYLRVRAGGAVGGWIVLAVAVSAWLAARPETIFVLVAFLAILSAARRAARERAGVEVRVAILSVLLFAALSAWRVSYFQSLFPQPVAAKFGGLSSLVPALGAGLRYLARSVMHCPVLGLFFVAPVGLAANVARRGLRDANRSAVVALAAAYLLFVCTSGGDWMEGGRLIVPILPALVVCWFLATERSARRVAVLALVSANLAGSLWFAHRYSSSSVLGDSSYRVARTDLRGYSPFEIINRVHYRDAVFLDAASRVVRRYLEVVAGRPLTVMSPQAGMVSYHLFTDHPGRLRFIDGHGLASPEFTDCPVTSGWARTQFGVGFRYDLYFSLRGRMESDCGVPGPDVVFDIDDQAGTAAGYVARNGYHVVYRQSGGLPGAPPFSGGDVPLDQYLAVSDRLFDRLPMTPVSLVFPK